MTFGSEGTSGARVHDIKDVEAILDVFRSHGHTEVRRSGISDYYDSFFVTYLKVDTATMYCGGTSEEYLGQINWKEKGLKLETKLWPTTVVRMDADIQL
ncbi:hypothetical protein C0991_008845 [Blastosporella zonata]|nr:hypothetical protein C0991_008845 [Blastosporella zonata]